MVLLSLLCRRLLRTKYFQCTCTRCEQVGDTVDDVISGLCCSQCGESGRLVEPELAAEIRAKRALELEASFAALGEFEEERRPTKSNLKQKQKKMKVYKNNRRMKLEKKRYRERKKWKNRIFFTD